jgi:2-methylcitrate dehydratase
MTQVEALAKYAARASFADLSAQSRQQLPVHILDSLGCCIAALGAGPVEACRAQVADFGGDGPCALIGGGNSVLAHRAGALRRLHGQFPGANRDLPYSR